MNKFPAACPDCPPARRGTLPLLVGEVKSQCAFHCPAVEARAPVPGAWFGRYALGLVRRGIVIRQRLEASGDAVSIDAVGPGAAFPLASEGAAGGYAASRLLVCLVPNDRLDAALTDADTVRDLLRLRDEAMARVERIAAARGRRGATERIAALLTTLRERLSPLSASPEHIPLMQRDLGALAGLRHETVCRALAELETERILARRDDGVEILDLAALARR